MGERIPGPGHLWTSAEAARAFRVGVSSIKRWTDEGELESIRTPGGHRRYTPKSLHHFAAIRGLSTDLLPPAPDVGDVEPLLPAGLTLYDALAKGDEAAVRKLVTPRVDSLPKRAAFLDRVVGDSLREIGSRWERAELGVDEEHRASQIMIDAVDRLRPPLAHTGRLALLACPPDELHDLPLRLVRLVLEWSGWRTELLGASLPWSAARAAIERSRPAMIAFSARSTDPFQYTDFDRLVAHCTSNGTRVVIGGQWARGGTGGVESYLRFRTLRGFERWLRTI
jgi:methanogenic corrinoid protein MtbC1